MTTPVNNSSSDDIQLDVDGIFLRFGGVNVLANVSTSVKKGEIFAIIGPNGAGKTSLLNCINRFYNPENGKIIFEIKIAEERKTCRFSDGDKRQGLALIYGQNSSLLMNITIFQK